MQYKLKKISGDASFREFYRLYSGSKTSIIVSAKKEKYKNLFVYSAINQILNNNKISDLTKSSINQLNIKTNSDETFVLKLSGGNQQKIALGKWLPKNPKLLIIDEPTRGVDVGAKQEVYKILRRLAREGTSIMLISSELPEIIGMCDRTIVMQSGATSVIAKILIGI